ncbi:MAG: alpha/beta fold hydrolase [Bdellovibrionales bacterium]
MSFTEKHIYGQNDRDRHKIVYSDWGAQNAKPLVCIHGLTGNGHDFDYLAQDLTRHDYRLICIDLAGRGRSDFLADPQDYTYDQYLQDINAVLVHEGLDAPVSVDWLGVSLGGLLGIRLAGVADTPIRRLILNDIGPVVPQAALDFIYLVISQRYTFEDIPALEARMRATRGLTWGPVTDAQWHHMAEHNARALEDGQITYAYDPAIAEVFQTQPIGDLDLWPFWDAITCPTLVIQGKQSVLLTDAIVEEMQTRGPDFDLIVFEGCGHVPSLMAENQIEAVRGWLSCKS